MVEMLFLDSSCECGLLIHLQGAPTKNIWDVKSGNCEGQSSSISLEPFFLQIFLFGNKTFSGTEMIIVTYKRRKMLRSFLQLFASKDYPKGLNLSLMVGQFLVLHIRYFFLFKYLFEYNWLHHNFLNKIILYELLQFVYQSRRPASRARFEICKKTTIHLSLLSIAMMIL